MQERRKKRRFAFKQEVVLKLCENGIWNELRAVTENVSEIGVLILVDSSVPALVDGDATVEIRDNNFPVRLSCPGKVVRVDPILESGKVPVAVRCNHGLTISKAHASGAQN